MAARTKNAEKPVSTRPKDAAAWKSARRHSVVLPSGVEVDIEIPNLPVLIKTGQIPNDLVDDAIASMQGEEVTREVLEQQSEFYHKLVSLTVKEPVVTEADVADLPYEDIELLVEIATRQRDVDALGRHIAGLHKSDEWRTFRGLDGLNSALAGL